MYLKGIALLACLPALPGTVQLPRQGELQLLNVFQFGKLAFRNGIIFDQLVDQAKSLKLSQYKAI